MLPPNSVKMVSACGMTVEFIEVSGGKWANWAVTADLILTAHVLRAEAVEAAGAGYGLCCLAFTNVKVNIRSSP